MMKKLYCSRKNKMICGVCGGIGEFINLDPTIVRLIYILLMFCSFGTLVLAYFIMAIVIPAAPETEEIEVVDNNKTN
ncbi:MAG: PspC domain-containing protein [Oscillospiraceae bacterium]|nr:PspC domain-containing protein [Oscillospiraceae bacterium]